MSTKARYHMIVSADLFQFTVFLTIQIRAAAPQNGFTRNCRKLKPHIQLPLIPDSHDGLHSLNLDKYNTWV
ncbi:hypothetical protein FKM82_003307 [Ascaphus truei]